LKIVPFIKYRFIAYGLSLSLFVIFIAVGVYTKGLVLGVDFVGGQKIIAQFEKGVDEAQIRTALTAYNPMVQQIGEADSHQFIISTKLREDSIAVTGEEIRVSLAAKYPKAKLQDADELIISMREAVDVNRLSAVLAGADAEVRKIGDPAKNEFIIYKKERTDKKKLLYSSSKAEGLIRGSFEKTSVLNSYSLMIVLDNAADEKALSGIAAKYGAVVMKNDAGTKPGYIIYKIAVDETEEIRAVLEKKFKSVSILSTENVGPAVGSYLRKSAVKLIIVSILLMTVYLAYRFEFRYSVGAMVAVLHDVILSIAFCGFSGIEINISVVAALLTIFGYSVNDTIVIFDRIRESTQIETKISFVDIVNKAITLTMSRTILTSFLTILTVFALFVLGGEGINDFAQVLLFGMIIGVYSTVYIASPVVISWEKLMMKIRS
jgi:preprotein translocase subunit SecF